MEINITRMNDYNQYNITTIRMLYDYGHVSAQDMKTVENAIAEITKIYAKVKAGKAVDGSYSIINALNDGV